MAMHAGCRCSGTQAEGGYSIQSLSLLCEGDNSGWGVDSLNPEALHLISSATETYNTGLYKKTKEWSGATTDDYWQIVI